MLKKFTFLILFIVTVVFVSGEEIGNLSISLTPGASFPLGDSTSYFTPGGGAGLSTDFRFNSLPLFFFKLDTAYSYIPIKTKDAVSIYTASAGGGLNFNLMGKLNLAAYGTGGYFYSAVSDGSGEGGGNIALKGGLSVSYAISSSLSILGDVHYLYNFYLNQGIGAYLGASYTFPLKRTVRVKPVLPPKPELLEETTIKRTGKGLEISLIELNKVFPVLF